MSGILLREHVDCRYTPQTCAEILYVVTWKAAVSGITLERCRLGGMCYRPKIHVEILCIVTGDAVVSGIQLGNVWIGVQPALGVEGDPMRLLFERDLTPHPQYAAFYKWLQEGYAAHAVLHFGMHGTVEWLPGAPLGESLFLISEQCYMNNS